MKQYLILRKRQSPHSEALAVRFGTKSRISCNHMIYYDFYLR